MVVAALLATGPLVLVPTPADPGMRGRAELVGQSVTRLSDGRWLLLGGMRNGRATSQGVIVDPAARERRVIDDLLPVPRAWHTTTVLGDGRLVVVGGEDAHGRVVARAAIIARVEGGGETLASAAVDANGVAVTARTRHTATLLRTGQLLLVGGRAPDGRPAAAVRWDPMADTVSDIGLPAGGTFVGHRARLLPDGMVRVAMSGDRRASEETSPEPPAWTLDTREWAWQPAGRAPRPRGRRLVGSLPEPGATGVPVDTHIALQFSVPIDPRSIEQATIEVRSRRGPVPTTVVSAEDGGLLIIRPDAPLLAGTWYRVLAAGLTDEEGRGIRTTRIRFRTAGSERDSIGTSGDVRGTEAPPTPSLTEPTAPAGRTPLPGPDGEVWNPGDPAQSGWRTTYADSKWQHMAPRRAPAGVTALAGQVLRVDGVPLRGVAVEFGDAVTKTDGAGRFLLRHVDAGCKMLVVDARTLSTPKTTYGRFMVAQPATIVAGATTVLPFTVWLPVLDMAHAVTIPSPTTGVTVLTTPLIPGLEVHFPAGVVIRDPDGAPVTTVSITPLPLDRPPHPLPPGERFPVYFTLQPGGSRLETPQGQSVRGLRIIYPNYLHVPAGSDVPYWNYDCAGGGWSRVGFGRVAAGGRQILPPPGPGSAVLACAIGGDPDDAPKETGDTSGGDPVDLATGLFTYRKTDLMIPDVIPILFTRSYQAQDALSRSFGVGALHAYDLFLVTDIPYYTWVDLVLPGGQRVHFGYVAGSIPWTYTAQATTRREFQGSTLTHVSSPSEANRWDLQRKDGTVYEFAGHAHTPPVMTVLTKIRDRHGNTVTIERESADPLTYRYRATRIVSPNGRWISITYDPGYNRIAQVTDAIGRVVTYTYHPEGVAGAGRLWKVTDPEGGVTEYTYYDASDACPDLHTITDPRGIVFLTNEYYHVADLVPSTYPCLPQVQDTLCAVKRQTQADGTTYAFTYEEFENPYYTIQCTGCPDPPDCCIEPCVDGESWIVATTVTDPRGYSHRWEFDSVTGAGWPKQPRGLLARTQALGTPLERTTIYNDGGTNSGLITSIADHLGRRLEFGYDARANVTSVTQRVGTTARTHTLTYEPTYNQLASITDPDSKTTTLSYDASGDLSGVTDATNRTWDVTLTGQGQLATITDPLDHATTFAYDRGDLVSVTDPLGGVMRRFVDAVGRVRAVTDPTGRQTAWSYDGLNRLTRGTDSAGEPTMFTYDENGNLRFVTDARGKTTEYVYDAMDRLWKRRDPLYVTAPGPAHEETFTYDANGNLTTHVDRRGVTMTAAFDALDRQLDARYLPAGAGIPDRIIQFDYNVDVPSLSEDVVVADSRWPAWFTFDYDGFDELASETTQYGQVTYTYDAVGRPVVTQPPGAEATWYGYDAASRLTQVHRGTYPVAHSAVSVTYDAAGRRDTVTLPNGMQQVYGYDAADRVTGITYQDGTGATLGDLSYGYDAAGNRTRIGGAWQHLTLPAAVASATYDDANRLLTWGGTPVTHDNNGNVTSLGPGTSVTWNTRNELTWVTQASPSMQWEYRYDVFGRRLLERTNGADTTCSVYDGLNPVQTIGQYGGVTNHLVGPDLDEWYGQWEASGARRALLTDALGSTVKVAADDGSFPSSYTYAPYGATTVAGATTNRFRFTGREADASGLYHYRARTYHPGWGRFVSEDPLGLAVFLEEQSGAKQPVLSEQSAVAFNSGYSYAANAPMVANDPLGLLSFVAGGSGTFVTGGGGTAGGGLAFTATPNCAGVGAFGFGGVLGGWDISAGPFVGLLAGGTNNIRGRSIVLNRGFGPITITSVFNTSGRFIGGALQWSTIAPYRVTGSAGAIQSGYWGIADTTNGRKDGECS